MGVGRRQLFIIILDLFIIALLASCSIERLELAPPTIKIGLVAPFEGLHRPLGYEALFAVRLAVHEWNASQGNDGYRVELVALNDFNDPNEAKAQAKAVVVDPDVLGVVGHLSAATTMAAIPVYQEAELAVSVPWTMAANPGEPALGVVNVAANETDTVAYLRRLIEERRLRNIVTLTNENLDAVSADTQAVKLVTDGVTAGTIMLALEKAKVSVPVLGQVDVGSPQVIQVAETAANGLIFVSPGPAPEDVAASSTFVDAYQSLAGFAPGPRAVLAYDAAYVLLGAIEQAGLKSGGRPTRAEVSRAITKVTRRGLTGIIAFDRHGQRVDAPVWIYQIEDRHYPGRLMGP